MNIASTTLIQNVYLVQNHRLTNQWSVKADGRILELNDLKIYDSSTSLGSFESTNFRFILRIRKSLKNNKSDSMIWNFKEFVRSTWIKVCLFQLFNKRFTPSCFFMPLCCCDWTRHYDSTQCLRSARLVLSIHQTSDISSAPVLEIHIWWVMTNEAKENFSKILAVPEQQMITTHFLECVSQLIA